MSVGESIISNCKENLNTLCNAIVSECRSKIRMLCGSYDTLNEFERISLLVFLCQYLEINYFLSDGKSGARIVDSHIRSGSCTSDDDSVAIVFKARNDVLTAYGTEEQKKSWNDAWYEGNVKVVLQCESLM